MNTFGKQFCFTTFGESHGRAIGCVVDGVPSGLVIDETFIQAELDRRKPGLNKYATARKEGDKVEILSGVFEGKSTGTPIAMVIFNENQKSGDYENVKDLFRPGHADFTYFHKYGFRDYRGGGRSSARETAARVAAGAIAKLLLASLHVKVQSGICAIGGIEAKSYDFSRVAKSEIYALDESVEEAQKAVIMDAKNAHDSVGGVALVHVLGAPKGLGEPLYYKLDALLADAMMGINGVKGVEIGEGFRASELKGSENNDAIHLNGFESNKSGGVLGGISNGDVITCKIYFKPTPSIFISQNTIDKEGKALTCTLKGRHDPCIAVRGSVVAESMAALVIADLLLLNMGSRVEHLHAVYLK
jgi:chorismate synthase